LKNEKAVYGGVNKSSQSITVAEANLQNNKK